MSSTEKCDKLSDAVNYMATKLAGENDVYFNVADAIYRLAGAIRPYGGDPARGVGGGIDSLMEAVMDVAHANSLIADSINNLADAVRESRPPSSQELLP